MMAARIEFEREWLPKLNGEMLLLKRTLKWKPRSLLLLLQSKRHLVLLEVKV
jgi:hypothetical protein